MLSWRAEIAEFGLRYTPRSVVKGHALADFIVECTIPLQGTGLDPEAIIESCPWVVYMDDSTNKAWSDVGIVLESPKDLVTLNMPFASDSRCPTMSLNTK